MIPYVQVLKIASVKGECHVNASIGDQYSWVTKILLVSAGIILWTTSLLYTHARQLIHYFVTSSWRLSFMGKGGKIHEVSIDDHECMYRFYDMLNWIYW